MKKTTLFELVFAASSLATAAYGAAGVAVWSAQTNTTEWDKALDVKYSRQGCSNTPANCMSLIGGVASSLNVKVTLHIPLNNTNTAGYALQYSTLSLKAPYLFEVAIDDFVSQYKALFSSMAKPSTLISDIISDLKSANPNLNFGATIYEDDLTDVHLQNADLPAAVRAKFDYVHLFIHYREDGPDYAGYVKSAKSLFPNARIIAGSYAYDRRAFLPCAPAGSPCTQQQDFDLFKQALTIQAQEVASGTVDHIEFYPGYFGAEEQWPSWNVARECDPSEIPACIANTKAMREAALGILGGSSAGTWKQLSAAYTPPVPRYGQSAVMDSNSHRMIVFGGTSKSTALNDTWLLFGADGLHGTTGWAQAVTVGKPPAANFSEGMYDEANSRMMLYGGASGTDVWVLSNANAMGSGPIVWSKLLPMGAPPPVLDFWQAHVYDPTHNVMIVYDSAFGVWTLSNANGLGGTPVWTQLALSGSTPPARDAFTGVYDPASNRLIMFGGDAGGVDLNDYWVLTNANGLSGIPEWIKLAPGTSALPAARSGHVAVYDSLEDSMTIFGGNGKPAETWSASHASGVDGPPVWKKVGSGVTASGLDPLTACTAVFDTNSLSMIIFGGYNTSILNDTFVLTPIL